MKMILFAILMLPVVSQAQKVLYDKTDPFTNERSISVGNAVLSKTLQASVYAKIKDTSKVFYMSFLMEALPGLKVQTADSASQECKLKTSTGLIFSGRWFGRTEMPIGQIFYHSATYIFTEDDFRAIASSVVTHVKVDGNMHELQKTQGNIAKLCTMLLSKL